MSGAVIWKGLALVDAAYRMVPWHGSETPKLFHSEEQGAHHRTDGCTLQLVSLVLDGDPVAPPDPAPGAAATPAADSWRKMPAKKRRVFAQRSCARCAQMFTPRGGNSKYCKECC